MAEFGSIAIMMGFFLALYVIAAYIIGIKTGNNRLIESARGGTLGIAALTTITSAVMVYALMTSDFSIKYVYQYTERDLPVFYKFSAWWAGNAGSLLLWAWVLSVYAAIVAFSKKGIKLQAPYVGVIMNIVSAFFLAMLAFVDSPFLTFAQVPPDGNGLNPMLQNPGMVFHPITLYLGYVGFTVPFAYAMAALITKNQDVDWIKVTRKWTIVSWMFLSLGNIWGAQWAYVELGWGGFWAWDPVENASFIPWLTASAFLHSVMIQERKDMLKIWNMVLIVFTFALTLFGTFLVRSGVLSSVHSFSGSALGPFFLGFTIVVTVSSFWLIADRLNMLKQEQEFESLVSKESSFLLNNLLLVGMAFAVFWGTVFPLVSEAVKGIKIVVGAPFFNRVSGPIGLAFILLMGICPLIGWRKASLKNIKESFLLPTVIAIGVGVVLFALGIKELYPLISFVICAFVLSSTLLDVFKAVVVRRSMSGESFISAFFKLVTRNRRRYGGYIIHIGIVFIVLGVTGQFGFSQEIQKNIRLGEQLKIGDYVLTYYNLDATREGTKDIIFAEMTVTKDGKTIGIIKPEKIFYDKSDNPSTEVGILSTYKEDLYVILAGWEQDGAATFKVIINPLVAWMWLGGYLLVIGSIFAVWPGRGSEVAPRFSSVIAAGKKGLIGASILVLLFAALPNQAHAMEIPPDINLKQMKEIEIMLICQDGCLMNLATCENQTAEFMRTKIIDLMRQNKSQEEILNSFVETYGQAVLAAPPKKGFNLTAWVTPFAAIAAGGTLIFFTVNKWVLNKDLKDIEEQEQQVEEDDSEMLEAAYGDELNKELEKYF